MFNAYIRERQNEIVNAVIDSVKIKSVRSEFQEGMPFDTENQITSWAAVKVIYEVFAKLNQR